MPPVHKYAQKQIFRQTLHNFLLYLYNLKSKTSKETEINRNTFKLHFISMYIEIQHPGTLKRHMKCLSLLKIFPKVNLELKYYLLLEFSNTSVSRRYSFQQQRSHFHNVLFATYGQFQNNLVLMLIKITIFNKTNYLEIKELCFFFCILK